MKKIMLKLVTGANVGGNLKNILKHLNKKMKESATNLEFEEAAKIRDEIRKLESTELEVTLNPKVKQYMLKTKYTLKEDLQWVCQELELKKVKEMEANKIIITGGATRIGAAIAKKLSGPKAEIVIHFNKSKTKAEKIKKRIIKKWYKVYLVKEI